MNCKPGDLAIIISESKDPSNGHMAGRLVEVLYIGPSQGFTLPDGRPHTACSSAEWVCKSLGLRMARAL